MERKFIEFFIDKQDYAHFKANNAVGDGVLKAAVNKNIVPCPISIIFERKGKAFSFAMSKSEARKLITYLIAEGV